MNTEDQPIDLREIMGVIRRRLRLVALTVILGLSLAASFLALATPRYTATALLMVDPASKNLLDAGAATVLSASAENARLESEVEILRSDAVAVATVERADLLTDPEFAASSGRWLGRMRAALPFAGMGSGGGANAMNNVLANLARATTVDRRGSTFVIGVSVTSAWPDKAARIANAIAETYIALQIEAKVAGALAARDVILAQLEGAQARMAARDEALASYIDRNAAALADESGSTEALALNTRRVEKEALLQLLTERLAATETAMAGRDWLRLSQSLRDDTLALLARQISDLRGTQAAPAATAGDAEQLETELAAKAAGPVAALRVEAGAVAEELALLRENFRQEVLRGDLSSTTLAEIFSLRQDANIAREQYQTLLARQRALEAQAVVQIADSRVVSAALPPGSPSYPDRSRVVMLALGLFATLGLALAFMVEYFIGGVTSAQQLAHLLPAQPGAVLPKVASSPEELSAADRVTVAPMSPFAEALRQLRAEIDQKLGADEPARGKVIAVVSTLAGEGKSTVALALARTYATAGRRTLLVDGDLRNPALHRYLGHSPDFGLLDFLTGQPGAASVDDIYDRDLKSPTGVIMGRGVARVPTDQVLRSPAFEALVSNARSGADVTVIDTPPLLPVVDARYIIPNADAVVLVVRHGATPQQDLRDAYARLQTALRPGTPVLTVLNQDPGRLRSYVNDGYFALAARA